MCKSNNYDTEDTKKLSVHNDLLCSGGVIFN